MHQPAKHGVIVYSDDIDKLALFYTRMFNMQVLKSSEQMYSLYADGLSIVIHEPLQPLPETRCNAVKLFTTVDSHADAHELAQSLGGLTLEGQWANPLFSVSNITDCDGNVIQLRVFS